MDFTGYDDLTLEPDEREWLKTLRQLSKRDHVEYGIAARGSWVSRFFTDQQPNSVHIPSDIQEKLYFMAKSGEITREKSGNTYVIYYNGKNL